jgi:hypothetical protein
LITVGCAIEKPAPSSIQIAIAFFIEALVEPSIQ